MSIYSCPWSQEQESLSVLRADAFPGVPTFSVSPVSAVLSLVITVRGFCFCRRHLLLRGGRAYPAGRSCAAPCSLLDSSSKYASHQNFPLCSAASGLFRNETVVSLYSVQKVSAYPAYGAWAASAVKDGLSLALDRYSAMIHPQSKRRVVSN